MKKLLPYILMISLFLISTAVVAQTGPDDPSVDDPAVPVDGGLSLLLAAGAAYGAGRLRRRGKGKDSRLD